MCMLHYSHIQPSPPGRAPQPRPIRGGRASPSPGDKQWCPPRLRSHIRNAHPFERTHKHAHTHTNVSMHACTHAQTRSGTQHAHLHPSAQAPQAHMCTPARTHTPHARALCTHAHRGHMRTGAHTRARARAHPCAHASQSRTRMHTAARAHKHATHNPSLDVVLQSSLTSTGL